MGIAEEATVHPIPSSCLMNTDVGMSQSPNLSVGQKALLGILIRCSLVVMPTPWKSVKTKLALW